MMQGVHSNYPPLLTVLVTSQATYLTTSWMPGDVIVSVRGNTWRAGSNC